jgi:hypothetical protein
MDRPFSGNVTTALSGVLPGGIAGKTKAQIAQLKDSMKSRVEAMRAEMGGTNRGAPADIGTDALRAELIRRGVKVP